MSPPAALYYTSRDRRQEHPERLKNFAGVLPADAYGVYNPLFKLDRHSGPLIQALCWAFSRRKSVVLADIATNAKRGKNAAPISPVALEAVKRIDASNNMQFPSSPIDRIAYAELPLTT